MGKATKPLPVKLVVGCISRENGLLQKALQPLTRAFGDIDYQSAPIPFTFTNYYEKEFGKDLTRTFISFNPLILPEKLPRVKIFTNSLEATLAQQGRRCINIDPGYLTLAKFVLASTKDYAHRIYLGKGIYAETTLLFKKDSFQPWEWTYPDYRTQAYIEIFNRIREIYSQQVKDKKVKV
ncbi:MAG: DUF4416 family protein [Candidatus Omnitrophica bacterium]|nr:DUF4416 family protein [Candidatus Omnitrophota bacterium]